MSDEILHEKIEQYIADNMPATGYKYSHLRPEDARDFSLPDAPLLSEGSEPYIIFRVSIQRGVAAGVGNLAKRRVGIILAELHLPRDATDRDVARMIDKLTPFLERKNFNGVLVKDANEAGEFKRGKWQVRPWTFDFKNTITLT